MNFPLRHPRISERASWQRTTGPPRPLHHRYHVPNQPTHLLTPPQPPSASAGLFHIHCPLRLRSSAAVRGRERRRNGRDQAEFLRSEMRRRVKIRTSWQIIDEHSHGREPRETRRRGGGYWALDKWWLNCKTAERAEPAQREGQQEQ